MQHHQYSSYQLWDEELAPYPTEYKGTPSPSILFNSADFFFFHNKMFTMTEAVQRFAVHYKLLPHESVAHKLTGYFK